MPKAIVLGAGISGLAAARQLRRQGFAVTVLEAAESPGGSLTTLEKDGFRLELGPNTVQQSPELLALCQDAGCEKELVPASSQARRRYVVHRGRPVALPSSPVGLVTTPLLSLAAKARLLTEPCRRRGKERDESVSQFFSRRLGAQVLHRLGDAMVLGIYAGDPQELAVRYAFPRLEALEREHGSLLRGMLRGPRLGPAPLVSCRGGLGRLAALLAQDLDVMYKSRVQEVVHDGEAFQVTVADSDPVKSLSAGRLITALPALATAEVLGPLGDTSPLRSLPHAPVAVVGLGYRRQQVSHPLDGFGLLAPHGEGRRILGCLFSSTLYPKVTPPDHVLVTAMVGGRRHADLVDLEDDALLALAQEELRDLLESAGAPVFHHLHRWRPGIPQPTRHWSEVRPAVEALEQGNPGLTVLGHWIRGVGIPQCVQAGWTLDSDGG